MADELTAKLEFMCNHVDEIWSALGLDSMSHHVDRPVREIRRLKSEVERLTRERADEKTGRLHNLHEAESLRGQLREATAARVRLTRERDAATGQLGSVSKGIERANGEVRDLRVRLADVTRERDRLLETREGFRGTLAKRHRELTDGLRTRAETAEATVARVAVALSEIESGASGPAGYVVGAAWAALVLRGYLYPEEMTPDEEVEVWRDCAKDNFITLDEHEAQRAMERAEEPSE